MVITMRFKDKLTRGQFTRDAYLWNGTLDEFMTFYGFTAEEKKKDPELEFSVERIEG